MLVESYGGAESALALVLAVVASSVALAAVNRARATPNAAGWWLAAGSLALGGGLWAAQAVALAAWVAPVAPGLDPLVSLMVLVAAVALCATGLGPVLRVQASWLALGGAAVALALAMAVVHYGGLAALRMAPAIDFNPLWVVLSLLAGVVASGLAVWLMRARDVDGEGNPAEKIEEAEGGAPVSWKITGLAAVFVAAGLALLYGLGMAAVSLADGSVSEAQPVSASARALALALLALCVLALLLVAALRDLSARPPSDRLAQAAQVNQELAQRVMHDSLTQLPNRALLDDRLAQSISRAQQLNAKLAVLQINIDGLKPGREAHGSGEGDQVLVEVTRRLQKSVRPYDTLARIGANEFVLQAEIGEIPDAAALAERLLQVIREPMQANGKSCVLSSSIGIALYPGDGQASHDLLGHAEAAMFHAKELGRNACSFFESTMNGNMQTRELVQELRVAIERGELVLHYQPEFASPNGPVMGVEALVRWQHPSRGLLMPSQFIGLAERSGLMAAIGDWVLDEACRQMAEWRGDRKTEARRAWTVAVNLSPAQFDHPKLVEKVGAALAHHGLEPEGLTLEVSESTLMRDVGASQAILRQLRGMGVRVAIDDFGAGYSSLMQLRQLPACELKIDGNFVRSLSGDVGDSAILASIVALGMAFDMKVVAVGVETAEQQMQLANAGCDALQGYYLARPMPPQTLMI